MQKCPFCNNECKDGAKICLGCGAQLSNTQSDDITLTDINQIFASSAQSNAPQNHRRQAPSTHNPRTQNTNENGQYDTQLFPFGYGETADKNTAKKAQEPQIQPFVFDTNQKDNDNRAARTRAIYQQAEFDGTKRLDDLYQQYDNAFDEPDAKIPQRGAQRTANRRTAPTNTRAKKAGKKLQFTPAIIILCGILAVAIAIAVFVAVMNHNYSIETFAKNVTKAVQTQNVDKLNELLAGTGSASAQEWDAFCAIFATPQDLQNLQNHILKLHTNKNAQGQYPAIGLTSNTAYGLWREYHLAIHEVSVTVSSAASNITLALNGQAPLTGHAQGSQTNFNGIFPGKYSYTVSGEVAGGVLTETGENLLLVDATTPAIVTLAVPTQDIVITNCISPNAVLYVDALQRTEKPSEDGTVTLPQVTAGSTVRLQYTDMVGVQYTSSITVQNGVAQYVFRDYTADQTITNLARDAKTASTTAAIDASGLNALTAVYFASYLDCINNQNMMVAQYVTPAHRERLEQRISSPSNKAYLYTFSSASVNSGSIIVGENATLTCNVQFDYAFYTRGKSSANTTPNTTYQTVLLVFQDGVWAVSNMQGISEDQFVANEYAPLG